MASQVSVCHKYMIGCAGPTYATLRDVFSFSLNYVCIIIDELSILPPMSPLGLCSRLAAAEHAHRAREQADKSAELLQQRPASSKLRAASAVASSTSMAVGGSRSGGSAGEQRGGGAGPSSLFILSETNRIRRFTKFLIECGAKQ